MSSSSRGWFTPVPAAADGSTLSEFVQKGRKREVRRTFTMMVVLHLLQIPLFMVGMGWWRSVADLGDVVPWRLLMAIDLGIILARLFVTYRAWGLLQSRRPGPRLLDWGGVAVFVVAVGSLVNFIGDVAVWFAVDLPAGVDRGWLQVLIDWCYRPGQVMSVVAMFVLLAMAFWPNITDDIYRAEIDDPAGAAAKVTAGPATAANEGTVICCSGGGIRASAFSLGGLQVLQDTGIYQKASAVIGVSGGGYTAAGHHVVRWNVHKPAHELPERETSRRIVGPRRLHRIRKVLRHRYPVTGDWDLQPADMYAFAPTSPELSWLRRHTRYILDSAGTLVEAVLSLAFGIAVNMVLVAVAIGAVGWLSGWLFLASGRLNTGTAGYSIPARRWVAEFGGDWGHDWKWVPVVWVVLLVVGVGAFVVEKLIDRFTTPWIRLRKALRSTSRLGLFGAAGAFALLEAVPWLVESAAGWAAGSPSLLAWLIHQAGVVPNGICDKMLWETHAGCGVRAGGSVNTPGIGAVLTINSVSIAAVVSSILAVLASLSNQDPAKGQEGKALSRFIGKIWAKVKDPVVPYVAVTVLAVVAVISLLRTVSLVVMDTATIADWRTGLILTGALILVRVFTEPNRTSMHQFFRERISAAFFVFRSSRTKADPIDYRRPLRFSEAGPGPGKGPRLIACAVANVTDSDLIPSKRGCTPFVFDDAKMGLTERVLPRRYAQRSSAAYEFAADEYYRDATIPAAVAMSAAAFSPLAGRENVRIAPYRVVLALGNARLGVWLPNPLWMDEVAMITRLLGLQRYAEARALWAELPQRDRDYLKKTSKAVKEMASDGELYIPRYRRGWFAIYLTLVAPIRGVFKKPGIFSLIQEAFGNASVYDRFLYVTDGGHYDNLGLIEALRRKSREIYVLDASNDPEDTFRALGQAMATAQMDLGCDVTIDLRVMRRRNKEQSRAAWCSGTCRYDDGTTGVIHVVKAILTKDAPWDIEGYATGHSDFPRTSTGRQLYSEFDFEAYRALGEHAVKRLLEDLEVVDARPRGEADAFTS
ncbi:MAG: hypothetical protein QOJ95_2871 [Mycobacterium sp.]|nr:hypothetical protein [Mycobacterium sp.]